MKKIFLSVFVAMLAVLLLFCSCNSGEASYTGDFFAMDTTMTITAYGNNAEKAVKLAQKEVNRLDDLLSVTNKNSEVYAINKTGDGSLSQDTQKLMDKSIWLYKNTNGAFDITVYPVVKAWGFIGQKYQVPSKNKITSLLKSVGSDKLSYSDNNVKLDKSMGIDFGGITKGYTSQRVEDVLADNGIKSAVISLGGNVQLMGKKNNDDFTVAIRNPDDEGGYLGTLKGSNCSIITSGAYERYFEQDGVVYHHIIDPKTGYPANSKIKSVTIISNNSTIGDGLSTALFVMGINKAKTMYQKNVCSFDFIIMTDDNKVYITDGVWDKFSCSINTTKLIRIKK